MNATPQTAKTPGRPKAPVFYSPELLGADTAPSSTSHMEGGG
jgi:hypothetical protein